MNERSPVFWSLSVDELLQQLQAAKEGLTAEQARQRLARYGVNRLQLPKRSDVLTLLVAQFRSPLILILLSATALSFFLRDPVDAFIILTIVLVSGLLGFWQPLFAIIASSFSLPDLTRIPHRAIVMPPGSA